jgi:hypothetical protein
VSQEFYVTVAAVDQPRAKSDEDYLGRKEHTCLNQAHLANRSVLLVV